MNKIFKIPNGELLTVPLDQEQDFLKQTNQFNTQTELVLDNSTDFDLIPPKKNPTIEDNPDLKPPEIKDYVLGDGVDFALLSPDEVLTMENAPDYFNLRSQAILFNKNSNGDQLNKLQNQLLDSSEDSEETKKQQDLYDLYSQNSGYLDFDLYGNANDWDEKAHERNKEVKDAIFSGEYGYNPSKDKLYKLDKKVEVNALPSAYQQISGFETYYDYVNTVNEKENTERINNEIDAFRTEIEVVTEYKNTGSKDNPYYVPETKITESLDNIWSYNEKKLVDYLGPALFDYGFNMEQTGGIITNSKGQKIGERSDSGDNQIMIKADNGKAIYLDADVNDLALRKKQTEIALEFLKENANPEGGYMKRGEMFTSQISPDKTDLDNWSNEWNNSKALLDKMRTVFDLPNASDHYIMNYYTRFMRYRFFTNLDGETELLFQNPKTGDQGQDKFRAENFGDLDITFTENEILEYTQKFEEEGLSIEDLPQPSAEGKLSVGIDFKLIAQDGKQFDLDQALRYYIDNVGEIEIDGKTVTINKDNYKNYEDEIKKTDKFDEILGVLQQSEAHRDMRDEYIKTSIRREKTSILMQKKAAELTSYFSSNVAIKSMLQKSVYQDVTKDKYVAKEEIVDLGLNITAYGDISEELDNKVAILEEKLAELGNPLAFQRALKEKYDFSILQEKLAAQKEYKEFQIEHSRIYNEWQFLTKETIPIVNDKLNNLYDDLDTSEYSKAEMEMMQSILVRNYEPGTYYAYQVARGIYSTVYGGLTSVGVSLTDAYLEIADLIGDRKDAPFYSIVNTTHKQFDTWSNQVQENLAREDSLVKQQMSFGDIEGVGDWAEYLFTGAINNGTILAVAFLTKNPRVASAILGTYSGAEKYNTLRLERNLFRSSNGMFGQDFNVLGMLSNAIITGTFESLSEKFTLGTWKRLGYFTKSKYAKLGFEKSIKTNVWNKKNVGKFLAYYGSEIGGEGFTEIIATFSSNVMDVWTGVEGASYFEGIDESFINGAFLSTLMTSPAIFKQGMIEPFMSKGANQEIAERYKRVQDIISKEVKKKYGGREYADLTESERAAVDVLVYDEVMAIEKVFEKELYKVDLLSAEQKQELIDINVKDFTARKEANEITADNSLTSKQKFDKIAKLEQEVADRSNKKNEILSKVDPKKAEELYNKNMDAVKAYVDSVDKNGDSKVKVQEVDTTGWDGVSNIKNTKDVKKEVNNRNNKIEQNDKRIKENVIKIDAIRAKKIKPLETGASFDIDAEIQRLKEENINLKKENKESKIVIDTINVSKDDVVGEDLLNNSFYGLMRPIYDGKTGNIKEIRLIINKGQAIKDGMWATASHEFTHALFANTIKGDTAMRDQVGRAMSEILSNKNVEFTSIRAQQMFNARIQQYDPNQQGEEALAIAAEMMATGDLVIKDSALGKIGNMFRRWSMDTFGISYKFNNSNDIKNFLKDYHNSIKNNRPSKAIIELLNKGANGKMFKDAKTPTERANRDMQSKVPKDLIDKFDTHTKNKDGTRKYKNNEEFNKKGEDDRVAVWKKIGDSGKNSLDSQILRRTVNADGSTRFDPKTLPFEVQQDYLRKVKENLQDRWLKNFNAKDNDSAAGYLFGKNGILYYAKEDVQKDYIEKEGGTGKRSLDRQTSDGQSYADVIEAEKDAIYDQIDNADLSPTLKKESKQEIEDLVMVMDLLNFSNNVKTAVIETVSTASINVEGLTYKGVRDLLLDMQSKATTEKNVVPTGPLFEVLNAVSTEFGIDPLRVLAKQDLNAEQRKAAQEYIYTKSINEDGSFNTTLLDILPEGQDRDGRATGVANTKLGDFYTKGKRLKVKEGAKKGLGQKFAQNKRTNITKEEFLSLFNINPDGSFQPGTKADGAIRELVVQVSQLTANQSIRINAIENRLAATDVIAKLKDGTSEIMYSKKIPNKDEAKQIGQKLKEMSQTDLYETYDRVKAQMFIQEVGKDSRIKDLGQIFDETIASRYNKDITQGKHLDNIINSFLETNPQFYDLIINNSTGNVQRSIYGAKEFFQQRINEKRGNQKYKPRNPISKKNKQGVRVVNENFLKKYDPKDGKERLNVLYRFGKAWESHLKTGKNPKPRDAWALAAIINDTVNNQNGGFSRTYIPFNFSLINPDGSNDTSTRVIEEHSGPQKMIATLIYEGARTGTLDKIFPVIEAVASQGNLSKLDDNVVTEAGYGSTMPNTFWNDIVPLIVSGELKIDQGLASVIRYAVPMKMKDGTTRYINLNKYKWLSTGKTITEMFGVNVKGELTDSIVQFQNELIVLQLTGKMTKAEAKQAIQDLNVDGLRKLDKTKQTSIVRNKLVALNNNIMYSKPVKVKGMSTFDFDDTLARTKSGVRYRIKNDTGLPATSRKVVFLAGSAGSGKSNVVKQLGLEGQGFKMVNQDISLEWLAKNNGLPTNMRDFTPEQMSKWSDLQWEARDIAQHKATKFKGRGDGVVVDGTGTNTVSMFTQMQKFKDAGYDVQMLYVESSLETALERNKARKERSLKDFVVERNWKAVQKNKKAFKEEFGNNFAEVNTDNLKQSDPMPMDLVNKMNDFSNGYIKGRLTAEGFANQGDALLEKGAEFDFSEFNKVVDGTPGPLLDKARNRAKKFGTKDMFVLTARPQQSAFAIQQFLKGQGLNIPIENITGLANSTGDAKAQWMLDKFAEGYNDMYFVDDALQNVEAVQAVLGQLDIKSNVVQAKLKENGINVKPGGDVMYSKVFKDETTSDTKDVNTEFNDIIERKKKIGSKKVFSSAEARKRGAKIGKFRFYIPPSAEDFKGLIYYFLGKGKQGDADMRFFEKTLLKPFAQGIRAWNTYKQNMVNEYQALKKQFPKVKRTKKVPGTSFTVDTAIRVYLWDKAGFEIPGISKTLQKKLVTYVNQNANVKGYAEGLSTLSRRSEGYVEPSNNWMMENISFDLRDIVERVGRQEFLQEWLDNKDIIFSPENLNKIEAAYGTGFRDALENILFRMENGTNRTFGQDKVTNRFTEWINGSVGAIMFFNTRSALLQTMSTVNFVNWSDNNLFKASAAFANQPQFWKDFAMIFNSPQLKQRRKGLQTDVSASELTQTFADNGYSPRTVINYLLQKGFLPTQIADSFAIAFGGASFYRNRYKKYIKEGMSSKQAGDQAMLDMQEIAEETQQSSREDLVSQQQAGPLGRIILAFQNVTMQYGRLTKKALSDIVNNRGDMKTNVSKLIYYGAVQNAVFLSLQSALAFLVWGDDEEIIDDKTTRVANGLLDSFLRGTGIYGAVLSTIKNTVIQWDIQSNKGYGQQDTGKIALELVNLSPPIGSKIRKIVSAFKTEQYNKGVSEELGLRVENPTIKKWASIIEAATNIPLARLLNKANNIEEAVTGQHAVLERIAMLLGWNAWELGVKDEELEAAKDAAAEKRAEKKKKEKEQKKLLEEKEKEDKKEAEEKEKEEKGIKTVRCSGIRSNGERCNMTTETAEKSFLCVHHKEFKDGSDTDGDGIKEYRCTATKSNGDRCKNKTENKNKKCYAHQ